VDRAGTTSTDTLATAPGRCRARKEDSGHAASYFGVDHQQYRARHCLDRGMCSPEPEELKGQRGDNTDRSCR